MTIGVDGRATVGERSDSIMRSKRLKRNRNFGIHPEFDWLKAWERSASEIYNAENPPLELDREIFILSSWA
jgi:hypothetical protein